MMRTVSSACLFYLYLLTLCITNNQCMRVLIATVINIGKGDQFSSGFVKINPNSKIPACLDKDGPGGESNLEA